MAGEDLIRSHDGGGSVLPILVVESALIAYTQVPTSQVDDVPPPLSRPTPPENV